MPLTHIDSADFMKLLGVAVKKFSPYNVNFPVRWANNPKYSQKLLLHIYVCSFACILWCAYLYLCIWIFVFFQECFDMNAPTLSVHCSISTFFPGAPIFPPPRRAFFNPRFLPQMNENCSQSAKVHKYTNANTKIHRCKYTNTQMQIHFSADKWMRIATKAQRCTTVALCSLSGELSCRQRPFVILCGAKSQKKGIFVLVNNIT